MALVQPGELAIYLHHEVERGAEDMAIRVAEGWLKPKTTSLPTWPDPVPEDLWAWALELAAMVYTNPKGLVARTAGEESQGWAVARRQEILDAAAETYGAIAPVGSFPPAPYWPR